MKGFVKVTLMGNLGADPELKTLANTTLCNLSVAVNVRDKQKDGTWGDKTEWVKVTCFGKTAENVCEFLKKGSGIYVDGRWNSREYEKDGIKRTAIEVVANEVVFLGGQPRGDDAGDAKPVVAPLTDAEIPF